MQAGAASTMHQSLRQCLSNLKNQKIDTHVR